MIKKILLIMGALIFIAVASVISLILIANNSLPQIITVEDFKPHLVTNVFARDGRKIGELYRERRVLVPYEKMPKHLIEAFLAAEDDQFFQHKGVNYMAIVRAMIANMRAGRTVQGGSTITQQVAKRLLLSPEKTLMRKLRDALLALKMEQNLSKEEILYLYLNEIYFGQSSYGVAVAAETYFRKTVDQLTLAEVAILAGLPQAPSRYSPVSNPRRAKERQRYVLRRMHEVGFIDEQVMEAAINEPVRVWIKEKYETLAPFYLEAVRQMLVKTLGEEQVLDNGLRVYTAVDINKQLAAQKHVEAGLREVDKRQGYRGPLKNITEAEVDEFMAEQERRIINQSSQERVINPDGTMEIVLPVVDKKKKVSNLPDHVKPGDFVEGVVLNIDDKWGLVYVQLPSAIALIDLETMQWARKPNPKLRFDLGLIKNPSEALSKGDVIQVRIINDRFYSNRIQRQLNEMRAKAKEKFQQPEDLPDFAKYAMVVLEQEPLVEGSLISFDLKNQAVLAMVGGRNFQKSEYNRAIQAARQTGSSFKSIVYAAALDKGYTPASKVIDAPLVYGEATDAGDAEGQGDEKAWKPMNHSKSFSGEILFRNALIKSLNIPTVKIIEDIGVPWSADYARRLGVFSPLNMDFTLALGSSSVTLYEMTKAFSHFARLGKRLRPILITKVTDHHGKTLLENVSLDLRFEKETKDIEEQFETRRQNWLQAKAQHEAGELEELPKEPPFFFEDADQLINPTTAYLMTSILKAAVDEPSGTGQRAKALGRDVAGKTGTTNGYYDGWFIGYTPQIATGTWVGFDQEKTLGIGEVGGRAALPMWVEYMMEAHKDLPEETFPVPAKIVVASIDNETGGLPSRATKQTVRQAFVEGTQPTSIKSPQEEESDFYKQDLSE